MVAASSYTASQLVQLGETEALCIQDNHHRSIGHIYTNFYYGGGNENLCFALHKLLHLCLLLGRFHLAMNLTQFEFRECLFQRFVTFFQVLQVALLAFLDQRKDDIYLSAEINLAADALIETGELGIKLMQRLYRFSARWQFINHAHVQVTINGHGEGAGDRSGGHHEDMRRILALVPQFGSLRHTEAMLLIDDGYA